VSARSLLQRCSRNCQMMNRVKTLPVIAITFLLLPASVWADHAPEWIMSTAEPEISLAEILVGETTIADAERRFGQPHTVKILSEDRTETEYVWRLPLSDLTVTTMHPAGTKRDSQTIYAVEVRQREGKQSRARTGAGVAVGADLDALIRAYGPRYMTSWRTLSSESLTVTFVFRNETELSVGFSDSGKINALLLVESRE
jgi:hypothetical protein